MRALQVDETGLGQPHEGVRGHPSVLIGDVDCTQHQAVCSQHGVRGYPTIKSFKAGEKEGNKYSGGRSKDALKTFVESNLV